MEEPEVEAMVVDVEVLTVPTADELGHVSGADVVLPVVGASKAPKKKRAPEEPGPAGSG